MSALSSNTKYYKEAFNLFKQCSKNDDRQDLANKVFEEASASSSDTVKIAQACSRELEQFLPFLNSAAIVETLFERLTDDQLDELIRDRAGCFLFEKFLLRLPKFFSPDSERVRQGYERLFQCVCANFDDYIKETGTSHIIAATIFFLHPLVEATHSNEYESLLDAGRTAKKFLELSADWGVLDKLRQIAKLVKKNTEYNEFVYAALLRTSGFLRPKLYGKLVNRLFKKHYSELTLGHLLNKNSSFVFEVLLEFSSEQRETLLYPLIVTETEQLYLHPIGNFLLQNFLLTVQKKELLESIYRQLTDEERFDKLLQQGHIRLLITFIRICERKHCRYEELVQRLKQSVQPESKEIHDFIPSVLKLRADIASEQLITKEGSLVVQALLRAAKIDSFTHLSFLALTGKELASIACHPSGSHLLCQLILQSSLWPILRRKDFYEKLQPFYSEIACDKAGCWFVTQLWKSAKTIDEKLHMARSMAKDIQKLRSDTYAKFITYEMNLVAFCSRAEQWQRTVEVTLKKHALLDDLDDQPKKKKKKNK